jgi:hypothetical protein
MTLNCNLPHFECFVKKEYLTNFTDKNKLIKAIAFAVSSTRGQVLQFHVLTEFGAMFSKLPISAIVWKEDYENLDLKELVTYDSFSFNLSNITYDYLKYLNVCYYGGSKRNEYKGTYLTTIDFYDSEYADDPGIAKCCHLIKLENGNFALSPNNRILWADTNTKPDLTKIDFKPLKHIFTVE